MARPKCCRSVGQVPACAVFKPAEVPAAVLEEVVLSVDELEAVRLADAEGLYHEQAAERMSVSRQTFGRILGSARNKIARALTEGMALRIEGGDVAIGESRSFSCRQCRHLWDVPCGTERPAQCPACSSLDICRCPGKAQKGCR